MAAELVTHDPPDTDTVPCSVCKQPISDADPVAHCPMCGWQEKWGAD